jgi:hypothetical protein
MIFHCFNHIMIKNKKIKAIFFLNYKIKLFYTVIYLNLFLNMKTMQENIIELKTNNINKRS